MRSPAQTLAAEHLDIRHQLLEIGAFLDRLEPQNSSSEPAAATPSTEPKAFSPNDLRLLRIHRALALLADPSTRDRARKLSLIFSGDDAEC